MLFPQLPFWLRAGRLSYLCQGFEFDIVVTLYFRDVLTTLDRVWWPNWLDLLFKHVPPRFGFYLGARWFDILVKVSSLVFLSNLRNCVDTSNLRMGPGGPIVWPFGPATYFSNTLRQALVLMKGITALISLPKFWNQHFLSKLIDFCARLGLATFVLKSLFDAVVFVTGHLALISL